MHNFTVHLEGEGNALVEAQVVQAHVRMSLWTVFHEIYHLNLDGRLRTEMLIVRLPVEEGWNPVEFKQPVSPQAQRLFSASESERSDTFDRVRDRAVHILTSHEGRHFLTENLNPHWPQNPLNTYGVSEERAIAAIRKAEFDDILDRSRAVLTSPPGSKFRAPSGRLLRSFVRVGNIQFDRDAVDAAFFWMLPHLIGVGAILTDTWSISSIAFNASRLCAVYFGGPPRAVEMLPSYNDGTEAAQARTRSVVERLDADYRAAGSGLDKVLCLISATQTGSLARHLDQIVGSSSVSLKPQLLALFALGQTNIPTLHDLREDPRFTLLDEEVEHPSEPVVIDPQVYFPLHFKDTVIEISKSIADKSRDFFDQYVGRRLVEVHRTHDDGTGRPRHHAIHLATDRLVDVPTFVKRYERQLAELPSAPKLIVSPPHPAGQALLRIAQDYFGANGHRCEIHAHPNLYLQTNSPSKEERVLQDILRSAAEEDAILIVDDVCVTGTRLSQYQRYIRTEGYRGRIDYLVGVARPSNPQVWANLERYLGYRGPGRPRHTLRCVDFILLPDWRDEDCPWCREKRLYERWSRRGPLPERLTTRLEVLRQAATSGLTSDLFLDLPGRAILMLGPDSLFTSDRANQAEVFAAVAAALQHLRSEAQPERPRLGPRRFPVSTVLNHKDYLCSKWTDSILRATFLRAASAEELTYADPHAENERTQALADLLLQAVHGEHEIALEILLAAGLDKCRVKDSDKVQVLLDNVGAGDISFYMLARLATDDRRA